jgi:hypothetical protein
MHLIQALILTLLVPHVFADHLFVAPQRRDEISAGPEMLLP